MAQLEKLIRPYVPAPPGEERYETYWSTIEEATDAVLTWTANTSTDRTEVAQDAATSESGGQTYQQQMVDVVEVEYAVFEVENPNDPEQFIYESRPALRTTVTWDVGIEAFANVRWGRWKVKTRIEDLVNNTDITIWDDTYPQHRDNLAKQAALWRPSVKAAWE